MTFGRIWGGNSLQRDEERKVQWNHQVAYQLSGGLFPLQMLNGYPGPSLFEGCCLDSAKEKA